MEIGADLGARKMANRPIFRTKSYYGVDMDEASLARGADKYPGAVPVHARLEDFEAWPDSDFVLCVQVFQLMDQFDTANTVSILEGVVNKIRPGGGMLINFGTANMPFLPDIRALLNDTFGQVDEFAPPGGEKTKLSPLIALAAMHTNFGDRLTDKAYFRCLERA